MTVTTGSEVAASGTFTVTAGAPMLTTITPNSGQQGQTLSGAITGQYTHFGASSAVSFGNSGVTAGTYGDRRDAPDGDGGDRADSGGGRDQRDGDDGQRGGQRYVHGDGGHAGADHGQAQQRAAGTDADGAITGQYTHFGAGTAVSFGNTGVTAGTSR